MDCPKCKNISNLSGSQGLGATVRRYRKCPNCDYRFWTYEIPEEFLGEAKEFIDPENMW